MARWNCLAARLMLMLLLALAGQGARADTAIRLIQSHVGNVNFVGTQETIRDKSNKQPCRVSGPSEYRYATLTGIPATATVLSAQLYWAGSGFNPDFNVFMDGAVISAPSDRRYYSTTIGNNYNYFSGAADVTAQVKLKRNSTYAFAGLTVDYDSPYCAVQGVLGGFSLLVIYSDASQPFRMLNLYEGFQYMRYSGITLNLSGFRVPDPIGTATGRLGHITWEGDSTLEGHGENLKFNNYEMTDSRNPSGNQFNSRSNVNGDDASYGIDFDAYTVGSPIIKSGQTTASTRYESGQDLVLLSAEVVALPNVPMADLSIAMLLNGELAQGQNASYVINVKNNGPSIGSSPTVVTSTLPGGLAYVAGAGAGWVCTNVGQDVSCSNTSALPAGSSLPALTLTVRVIGTGTITTSALVTGNTYDPQMANNAVSVKRTVSDQSNAFIFTVGACKHGLPFDDPGQTCTKSLPEVRAGKSTQIFITAMSGDVPTGPSVDTDVPMKFALSCHNPDRSAGVKAWYAGKALELCQEGGEQPETWSEGVNVSFKASSPSFEAAFKYDDVGLVELFMTSGPEQTLGGSITFVSVPYEVRFMRDDVGLPDSALAAGSAVFKAGPFDLEIGSYTEANQLTPNFGKESPAVAFDLPKIERAAAEGSQAWKDMASFPTLESVGSFFSDFDGGKGSGKFHWPEVGLVKLSTNFTSGQYLGRPFPIKDAYVRFSPHHFTTSAKKMDCVPNMKCDADVSTAAFSKEKISLVVTAMAGGDPATATKNYQGIFARKVDLSAWAGAARDVNRNAGLSNNEVAATEFKHGDGTALAGPVFKLPDGFVHTAPQSTWSAPVSIYLRATEAAGGDGVTSKSEDGGYEVGVRIVSGRLFVPNAHGSERLNLPLNVSAQYWTGTNWELSRTDQQNIVDPAKAVFSNFGGLSLSFAPATAKMLKNGVASFGVKTTPAAAGTADVVIDYMEWLPSTKARLKFGTYKSPLIYLRERH